MKEEARILKMLKEVVEDKKTGEKYWFDVDSYKCARDYPKPLSTRDICTKLELNTDIEIVSDEAFMKQVRRFNNYVDECKNAVSGDVNFIRNLGLALADNEMAFLVPITLESFTQIVNSIKVRTSIDGANEIYNQLNQVLYLLELSCYFNYIPSTEEDGEAYFSKLMIDIKKDVDRVFGDKQTVRKRLYELIDEVDFIVNSCEVPGVPDSWLELNPNINYFDCVYDIIEENPELYNRIKVGDFSNLQRPFRFIPSISDITARQDYFNEKRKKYPTRTEERLYQDELVETLNMRFNECIDTIKEELEERHGSK